MDVRARRCRSRCAARYAAPRRAAVRVDAAGAHSLRVRPGAQSQRRQRVDGDPRAPGGRRQVRRAGRRLHDEQLGVVGHHQHVGRRRRAGDARHQHESARAGTPRAARSSDQHALRLQQQSGGDDAGSGSRAARPRARGPLHRRVRAGDDRHGALRRCPAAQHDVSRGIRPREVVRAMDAGAGTAGYRTRRRIAFKRRRLRGAARPDRTTQGRRSARRARRDASRAGAPAGNDRR